MESTSRLLEGKVCLVTGASRGIGQETVRVFAEEGARVYANARRMGELDASCQELSQRYATRVVPLYFDVKDTQEAKKALLQINREEKHLDVLVNNAGIMQDALIGMVQQQTIQDVFETNVFAVIQMTQMATRLLQRSSGGSIINLSSIVGVQGNAGQIVYAASKGAVISMTKTAAKELAEKNIRVNAIAPGMIDTDMFRAIGEERMQKRLSSIGMRRLGEPLDVARVCLFFASDLSAYISGQILGVDGCAII